MAAETPLTLLVIVVVAGRWTMPVGNRDAVDIDVDVVAGRWTAPDGNGDAIDIVVVVVVVVVVVAAVDTGCWSTGK